MSKLTGSCLLGLAALLVVSLSSIPARADIAPRPRPPQAFKLCRDKLYANMDKYDCRRCDPSNATCRKDAFNEGYRPVCRAHGGKFYGSIEVWCRRKPPAPPPTPTATATVEPTATAVATVPPTVTSNPTAAPVTTATAEPTNLPNVPATPVEPSSTSATQPVVVSDPPGPPPEPPKASGCACTTRLSSWSNALVPLGIALLGVLAITRRGGGRRRRG